MSDFIACRVKDSEGKWGLNILRGSEPYSGMVKTGRLMGEIEEFCYPDDLNEILSSTKLK